jgi:hypothetical protein
MTTLIEKIEKIDPEAAEYLRGDAHKLESFVSNINYLTGIMSWCETPQGWDYWNDIRNILDAQEVADEE